MTSTQPTPESQCPTDWRQQLHALIRMTLPMLIGITAMMSFQLVDSVFIARLGIEPLAVIGFTIPIYQLFIGLQVGIGIATTALISQLLGAKKADDARELAGLVIIIGFISCLALVMAIWFLRYPILAAMGADAALHPWVDEFWSVWLASVMCGASLYFGYSICRANGNTLLPGIGMVACSLINIALDPLFIFTFGLGLPGAAWATLCSFLIGVLFIYPRLFSKSWLSFKHVFNNATDKIKRITAITLPAMTSQLLPAVSSMTATYFVAAHGTDSVAGWGMGIRIEFFSMILILATTMSLPPMLGNSYGAKQFDDIKTLLKLAIKMIMVWQFGVALLLWAFNAPISQLLTGEGEIADIVSDYIVIIPISYTFLGVCMLVVSASNAISQAMYGLRMSIIRLFICYLPCLYLGSQLGGLTGLMIGAAVGNVVAGILALWVFRSAYRKAYVAAFN